ncbi:hypothetical protein [Streptomyces sp. TR06-5]|uniref:hypothetical protein n=1 Tax=Streptomyces sp. TR06-5 TaxID=3385976 RepID=UPI00399FC405
MTAGADLRHLRAAVFTAVCVLLSAGGHALAAGAPLPLWTLGLGCALVFAVAAPLAGRERSLPGIAALLTVGQVALHTVFSVAHSPSAAAATAGASPAPVSGGAGALAQDLVCNGAARSPLTPAEAQRLVNDAGLSGHGAAVAGVPAGTPVDGTSAVIDAALAQLSLSMLLGHVLAAAAVGWLLRRGEVALWRLVRLSAVAARAVQELLTVRALRAAARLLRALRHALGDDGSAPRLRRRGPAAGPMPLPVSSPLSGGVTRRGPPSAADRFALAA